MKNLFLFTPFFFLFYQKKKMSQFENTQWQENTGQTVFNLSGLEETNDQPMIQSEIPVIDLRPVEVKQEAPLTGVYSSSGFDMVAVLLRLVNR